jgi:hypothetical protein
MIKISIGLMVLGAGALAVTSVASGMGMGDLTFTPRVTLGAEKYYLKWKASENDGTVLGDVIKADGYIPTLAIGGTVSMGSLYLDAYWQQTGTTEGNSGFSRNDVDLHVDSKADHKDGAISIGYSFENGASVFGGYKYGKVNIDGTARLTSVSDGLVNVPLNVDATFEASGPFLGAGYGWRVGPGLVSLTGAWAWLDGKTKGGFSLNGEPLYQFDSKPSASGLSISVGWKAPITDHLSYGISVDGYQYNFDRKTSHTPDGTETIPLKVSEQSLGLRASLAYHF